jgi:hypothetical protein
VAPPALPAVAPLRAAPAVGGALPRPIALTLPRPIGTAVWRGVEGAIVPVHGALFPNLVGAPTIGTSRGRLKQRRKLRTGLRSGLRPAVPSLLTPRVGGTGTLRGGAPLGPAGPRVTGWLLTATTGVPLSRATRATPPPGAPFGVGTAGSTLGRQRGRGRRRIEIGRLFGASARGGALAGTATTGTGWFVAHGLRDMWYGNRPAGPGRGAGGNPRGRGTTGLRKDGHVATHEDATTAATTRGNPGGAGAPAPGFRNDARNSEGERLRREARRRERVSLANGQGAYPAEGEGGNRRASTRCRRPPGHCGGGALSLAPPWRGLLRRPPPFAPTPRYPLVCPGTPEQSPREPLRATRGPPRALGAGAGGEGKFPG